MLPFLSRRFFPGNFLGFVGFLFLSYYAWKAIIGPILFYLKTRVFKRTDIKKYGDWAVVTGATSGIGMEFTHTFGKVRDDDPGQ